MALNPKTSTVNGRNVSLNNVFDALNSGFFRTYDGTQPTDADTALGAQVDLADNTFGATAFAAASAGSKVANTIGDDTSINATSTAAWCTLLKSGGVRITDTVTDMSAGTSGANVNFNSVAFASGATCSITSLTISQAA
jgi:hypothetical protein